MLKPLLKGSIIGGAIAYVWESVFWMFSPFPQMTISQASGDTAALLSQIATALPEKGLYPLPPMDMTNMFPKPFALVVMSPEGMNFANPKFYIISFLTQLIGAFIITYLLMQTKPMAYWCRVKFVTMIGLVSGALVALPNWNWWGFPTGYTVMGIIEMTVGWFLVGLVLAKIVPQSESSEIKA